MIPRLGEIRSHHFAHKREEDNCGSETYLHKLSKMLLRKKFYQDENFQIALHQDIQCSDKTICPFYQPEECHKDELSVFDLKKYYDTCEEEHPIGEYIADLLLTSSTKPDREPVLIEIQVSHKSTENKRNSGMKIVEVRVQTEDDIKKLLSGPLTEHPEAYYGYLRDIETIGYAKFFGFKKESCSKRLELRNIQRFYLYGSGKAFVTNMDDKDFHSCRNVSKKEKSNSIFEASIDSFYIGYPSPYEFGYVAAKDNGINVKTCQLCKYHKSGFEIGVGLSPIFCCLYKKYGTPENPEPQEAQRCQYYREDSAQIEDIRRQMPPMVVAS